MTTMGHQEAALSTGADHVRTAQSDVNRLCHQLTNDIQAARAQWQGGGGRAFQNLMVLWGDRQQRIVGALEALAVALVSTERDTGATDDTQAAAASGLAARLG